jgi:hypothetical protein
MATLLKKQERKKQNTTPNRTYSIKFLIVALCFAMDGRPDGKTIYLPTVYVSADIMNETILGVVTHPSREKLIHMEWRKILYRTQYNQER